MGIKAPTPRSLTPLRVLMIKADLPGLEYSAEHYHDHRLGHRRENVGISLDLAAATLCGMESSMLVPRIVGVFNRSGGKHACACSRHASRS